MIMNNKRRGLTLVEVVLSTIIFAIFSGVFTVSSIEAVSSSRMSRIVDSMRMIKTAALVWINNNPDHVCLDGTVNKDMTKRAIYLSSNSSSSSGSSKVTIQDALKDPNTNNRDLIRKYIGNGQNLSFNTKSDSPYCDEDEYAIVANGKSWFVCYKFPNITSTMTRRIREKAESRAHTEGLYKGVDGDKLYTASLSGQDAVYMKIIEF